MHAAGLPSALARTPHKCTLSSFTSSSSTSSFTTSHPDAWKELTRPALALPCASMSPSPEGKDKAECLDVCLSGEGGNEGEIRHLAHLFYIH